MSAGTPDSALLESPPALCFEDRVVWITGASRGLGRTMAFAFAGAGADLILSARSAKALEETATTLREHGVRIDLAPGSVTEAADVEAAVVVIEERHGKLDALVNNAGISPHFTGAEKLDKAALAEVLETNLLGAFACSRAALPLLEASSDPAVVNLSSVHGFRSYRRLLAYAVSKGGLEMLTRVLADEWAERGIRVNSLAPGYIETEMTEGLRAHDALSADILGRTPLGRFATPAEIAACAMFLASPIAGYVTGTTLFADGGWSAR
ncbi:MAG: SDR family NAD(P)-dependent oxidoreductase [Solirubrobacterales bacterium]